MRLAPTGSIPPKCELWVPFVPVDCSGQAPFSSDDFEEPPRNRILLVHFTAHHVSNRRL